MGLIYLFLGQVGLMWTWMDFPIGWAQEILWCHLTLAKSYFLQRTYPLTQV